jgi:hypothetical protein
MSDARALPTLGAMTSTSQLRVGAVAAALGAAAQVTAWIVEPGWGGDTVDAARVVSRDSLWEAGRVVDLIGVFLTTIALSVVTRTLVGTPGDQWRRVSQPFLPMMAAFGSSSIVFGVVMGGAADSWADAAPDAGASYLAGFEVALNASDGLMFCAFVSLGVFLAMLGTAMVPADVYPRWIGFVSAVSGALIVTGTFLMLSADAAFIVVAVGFVLFVVVLLALARVLWRGLAPGRPGPPIQAALPNESGTTSSKRLTAP